MRTAPTHHLLALCPPWNGGTSSWYVAGTANHVYDGWNRIALLSPSGVVTEEYVWGLDLSGSMQGAGGVGGMLLWCRTWDSGASWQSYYPCYDGNGNVTELLDGTGAVAAHWEYDPYGNTVASSPAPANWASPVLWFPFRFSTKPVDADTGYYYYGYRFYDPVTGRWPSRDPIEEEGGVNLYGFVGNDGVNGLDLLRRERLTFTGNIIHERGAKILDGKSGLTNNRSIWNNDFDDEIEGAENVKSIEELAKKMADAVKPYSKDDKDPCNCIEKMILWTHGSSGVISFGYDDLANEGVISQGQLVEKQNRHPALMQNMWKAWYLMQQLLKVRSSLCEEANIEIRACDSGKSSGLAKSLSQFMGNGVSVTLYTCEVAPDDDGGVIKKDPDAPTVTWPEPIAP